MHQFQVQLSSSPPKYATAVSI